MSYARRTVVDSGALPLSPKPRRIDASGALRVRRKIVAAIADVHGRRWTSRLHRYQKVSCFGLRLRCGIGTRNGLIKKLNNVTTTVKETARRKSGIECETTAKNETMTKNARAMSAARVVTSIRRSTMARSEGSNVIDAIIMISTPMTAPMASPRANARPMTNSPSSEMITVIPAKITARPDVSTALTMESSTLIPWWRPSR